jgi:hypothetical protein
MAQNEPDQDLAKGATETEDHKTPGNVGLQGQLGHRDQDPMIKDADSDFPEPGQNPEHTGKPWSKTASQESKNDHVAADALVRPQGEASAPEEYVRG